MKDISAIKYRYLQDELPVKLGGLAANLTRIKNFSMDHRHHKIVKSLLQESEFFIEWAAPEAEMHIQAELAELQIQIALWNYRLDIIWDDSKQRSTLSEKAEVWSKQILKMSGLIN